MRKIKKLPNRQKLIKWLPCNATIAEIGVARGDFSQAILTNTFPKKFHLIDAWTYQDSSIDPEGMHHDWNSQEKQDQNYEYVLKRFSSQIQSRQIFVHKGYSSDVLKEFPNGYFDWVYIDANHKYEFIKQDLELCRLKIKKGGLICGHDYIQGDTARGIEFGTIQAVNEFCKRYDWRIICLADHFWEGGNYQSYVLLEKNVFSILIKNLKILKSKIKHLIK